MPPIEFDHDKYAKPLSMIHLHGHPWNRKLRVKFGFIVIWHLYDYEGSGPRPHVVVYMLARLAFIHRTDDSKRLVKKPLPMI